MGDFSDGVMLALYPPPNVVDALALPDGLDPAELHVTVAYLGHIDDVDSESLLAVAKSLSRRAPLDGVFSGHARFSGEDSDVVVALLDSPGLEQLRRDTLDALSEAGLPVSRSHGYTAHLTRSYIGADKPSPVHRVEPVAASFPALTVMHGTVRTDFPFMPDATESIAGYARHAFAAGWARSGGPMTERVKAASLVAVQLACEHPHDPGIFELALDLGSLEGMWALLFARREALIADHAARIGAAWRRVLKRQTIRDGVERFQRALLLVGEAEDDDPGRTSRIKQAARDAAAAMLVALIAEPGWEDLRQGMRDALAAGSAEGQVAAVAIAAENIGRIGLDWDIAFEHAYQAMAELQSLWPAADDWLTRTLGRATADLGKALSDTMIAGGSYADMVSAATDAIGGADADAVSFVTDWAITTAAAEGALALYRSEGVSAVSWLDAGDTRVCPICQANAEGSPYPLEAFPQMPSHPLCVVGSTRIAVPSRVVTGDVPDGLTFNPAHPAVGGLGKVRPATAAAVTEPGLDFGRGDIRAVSDRYYVGDVVLIRTALGHELTATPNHPIATGHGWVPISELDVGDHVLCSTRPEWGFAADPNVENVPPAIHQVAQSFAVALGPVPTAAEDFHGDGAGSEVHVVRADGLLVDNRQASGAQVRSEIDLTLRYVRGDAPFQSFGALDQPLGGMLCAAHCDVSGFRQSSAFLSGGVRHSDVHRFAASARLNTGTEQAAAHDSSVNTEGLRQSLLALSGQVALSEGFDVDRPQHSSGVRLPGSANGYASSPEFDVDRVAADAEGFCEGVLAFALDVAADEIVHVERYGFEGHVYNLDTNMGWYVGNGILTHNCRCVPSAEFDLSRFDSWFAATS